MKQFVAGLLALFSIFFTTEDAFGQRRRGGHHGTDQLAKANGWVSNYQSALQQAKESGKPLMLVFRCVP